MLVKKQPKKRIRKPNKRKEKLLDPRQIKFLEYYLNPNSETYASANASAIKAGYSKQYAKVITLPNLKWLSDNIGDTELVNKAIKNLKEFLNEKKDKKIKADITKFVLERLNKKKFSTRTEIEHSGTIEEKLKVGEEEKDILNKFEKWIKTQVKK